MCGSRPANHTYGRVGTSADHAPASIDSLGFVVPVTLTVVEADEASWSQQILCGRQAGGAGVAVDQNDVEALAAGGTDIGAKVRGVLLFSRPGAAEFARGGPDSQLDAAAVFFDQPPGVCPGGRIMLHAHQRRTGRKPIGKPGRVGAQAPCEHATTWWHERQDLASLDLRDALRRP
jgi:hypothetical protein